MTLVRVQRNVETFHLKKLLLHSLASMQRQNETSPETRMNMGTKLEDTEEVVVDRN